MVSSKEHLNYFVSIIIPCFNEEKYIKNCILSILNNDYPESLLEIIVADGGSTDNTLVILEQLSQEYGGKIKVIYNNLRRQASGLNLAIKEAIGDIIIRIDAHSLYPKEYIRTMVKWIICSNADNVGAVCITKPGDNTPIARAIAMALNSPFGVGPTWFRLGISEPRWVDTVPFGTFRRSLFEKVGYYSESLYYSEDDEFNMRISLGGGKILLVPDVTIDYFARSNLAQLALQYRNYGLGKSQNLLLNRKISSYRQLIPPGFVLFLLLFIPLSLFFTYASWILLFIVSTYIAISLFFSISSGRRFKDWTYILMPICFFIIHWNYGYGFLKGLVFRTN